MENKAKKIFEWLVNKIEFSKEEFINELKVSDTEFEDIVKNINILHKDGFITETHDGEFIVSDIMRILKNKYEDKIIEIIEKCLISDTIKSEVKEIKDWDDIKDIEKFVIYEGSPRIYEIHIDGKIIKLEDREILDYNIFRLRFFEKFGILLKTYRGISEDWANIVTYWNTNYGEIAVEKSEELNEIEEAKELILDYVNNVTPTDNHVLKEGLACFKDGCIYIAIKIIKKILKRNGLNVSIRKLSYSLKDYLLSGSIPIKIENKSERFWRFDAKKFDIENKNKLKIIEENEDEEIENKKEDEEIKEMA